MMGRAHRACGRSHELPPCPITPLYRHDSEYGKAPSSASRCSFIRLVSVLFLSLAPVSYQEHMERISCGYRIC